MMESFWLQSKSASSSFLFREKNVRFERFDTLPTFYCVLDPLEPRLKVLLGLLDDKLSQGFLRFTVKADCGASDAILFPIKELDPSHTFFT